MLVIPTRCSSRGCEVMFSVMDRACCLKIREQNSDVEGQMHHHIIGSWVSYIWNPRNCFGGADPVADLHQRTRLPQPEFILLRPFIHRPSMVLYVLVNESNIRAL
jgi:hypothetical protein